MKGDRARKRRHPDTGISEGEAMSRRSRCPPALQTEPEPPGQVEKPPTVSKGLGVGRMV